MNRIAECVMTTIAPLGSSEDEISKIRTTDLNAHTQNTVDADLITQLNQSIHEIEKKIPKTR